MKKMGLGNIGIVAAGAALGTRRLEHAPRPIGNVACVAAATMLFVVLGGFLHQERANAQGFYRTPPPGANCSPYDYLQGGYWCDGPGNRRAAPAAPAGRTFETTDYEMKRKYNYCGTDGERTYYCPKDRACSKEQLGKCAPPKQAAQRPQSEEQAKSAADKIKAEKAKAAAATPPTLPSPPAASARSASTIAQAAIAADLVASLARFTELGEKAAAAVPAGPSAGFKGWDQAAETSGESPKGRGYATDYVRAVWEKVTGKPLPDALGEAGQWYGQAQALGLKTAPPDAVEKVPPGAIVVWDSDSRGHVAIVTRNDGAHLVVTEANWGGPRDAATRFERDNAITRSFNKHEERTLTYDTVRRRRDGEFKLVGFILAE